MAENDFQAWLCKKLTSIDIDDDVYGSYITGILEETDADDDKKAALAEILESLVDDSEELLNDVVSTWKSFNKTDKTSSEGRTNNIDEIIAAHVGLAKSQQVQPINTNTNREMDAIKQSVIAMYSSVPDEADDNEYNESESRPSHHNTVDSALEIMKNTNAEKIAQEEKMERLKRKEESTKKKEQDKADRELQKIKKAERKEKEKKRTQKKERTR